MKKIIFSGIQPTGDIHLGNYIGAIHNWVNLQKNPDYHNIYCIVDLHAITVYNNPNDLLDNSLSMLSFLLASGLDHTKSVIFLQSHNHHHGEMAWLLNCVCRIGWLNKMTQFKDKSGKNKDSSSVGLYGYPVLMASDILLYDTDIVPTGEDQIQHVELCRDIATKFNHDYGLTFKIPISSVENNVPRVMSLQDGTKKMSKSDPSQYAKILFTDSDDDIVKKIKKSQTDSLPMPTELDDLQNRPEVFNLFKIFAFCNNLSIQDIINSYADKNFSIFKSDLANTLVDIISPIRLKHRQLLQDRAFLLEVLSKGRDKSLEISKPKIEEVKRKIGLII